MGILKSLKQHLGGTGEDQEAELDQVELESEEMERQIESRNKRKRQDSDTEIDCDSDLSLNLILKSTEQQTEDTISKPFQFDHQGQWVRVFYDNSFYVGQVF